jgi:hypothetical protein
MTDKHYENLMYAISTLIAFEKNKSKPRPIAGIPYDEVLQNEEIRLQNETEEIYQNLTGSPSNREIKKGKTVEDIACEVNEKRDAEIAERARREELEREEKARLEELKKNEELARIQKLKDLSVTVTDNLEG